MHTNHPIIKTKVVLPSGNWFSGFICNTKTNTVCFNYRDRRRDDQIARRYTVKFNDELKVTDIIVVSIKGSRIEHFGNCRAEKLCRELLIRAINSQKQKEEKEQQEEIPYMGQVRESEGCPFYKQRKGTKSCPYGLPSGKSLQRPNGKGSFPSQCGRRYCYKGYIYDRCKHCKSLV